MNILGSVSRFGIRFRLGLVLGLGCLGLLTIAIVHHELRNDIDHAARAEAEAFAASRLADNTASELRSGHLAVLEFFERRDPALTSTASTHYAAVTRQLDALSGQSGISVPAERLTAASTTARSYLAASDTAVRQMGALGLTENQGLQGELRTAVHTIESRLDKLQSGAIGSTLDQLNAMTIKMLMMRRHEKDFMLRGNATRYMGAIEQRQTEFLDLLKQAPLLDAEKDALRGLLATYVAEVKRFAAGADAVTQARGEMVARFTELDKALIGIKADADRAVTAAREVSARTDERFEMILRGTIFASLAALLIGGYLVARAIAGPIRAMAHAMHALASGVIGVSIPAIGRQDEIGEMAAAVEVFRTNTIEMHRLREQEGEMRRQAEEDKRRAGLTMTERLELAAGDITEVVHDQAEGASRVAETMADVAGQVLTAADVASHAAENAAGNVETVAAASEELTASMGEINRQSCDASTIAGTARTQAVEVNGMMGDLSDTVQRIGEIVNMINAIAAQTNLLALNATIEAARAGDAGKGFAVVANEVKSLANQTARATSDIAQQINGVQGATERTLTAMRDITGTIDKVAEIASAIATAVEQQGAATQEISRNVVEAAAGTRQVSNEMGRVREAAEQTKELAAKVLETSAMVVGEMAHLRETMTATLRTSSMGDRRESPRQTFSLLVAVRGTGAAGRATVTSLSCQGVSLAFADMPPPVGTTLTLELPAGIGPVVTVVVRADGHVAGCHFKDLRTDQCHAVRRFMEATETPRLAASA